MVNKEINFSDLIGKAKTYEVTQKEIGALKSLKLFVDTLIGDIEVTNQINKNEKSLISVKSIALVREISPIVTTLKRVFESKIMSDSTFSNAELIDLGKELKKVYKKNFDVENFLKDFETNIVEIPKEVIDRFSKTVIRATRAPLKGEDTTKKTINIIDDLKDIAPKTKLDKIDFLREQNLVESKTATLSYTKIKK